MTAAPKPDYPAFEERKIHQPPAVGWFGVRQLAGTGLQALVTAMIGTRSARREVLAALDSGPVGGQRDEDSGCFDFSASNALWLDYVADLGDGFDATEAVAWLVGRDHVFVAGPGERVEQPRLPDVFAESPHAAVAGATALPAAGVLVFGGDETYPVASQENYHNRTMGPYFAARPWGGRDPDAGGRALFAIPGNHDWYDGLGAFVRCFCQPGRWSGCWQSQQTRSYFALRLPHGFWLWGVDLATEDDIDPPQLAYFRTQAARMRPGDQLVLCAPEPAWITRDATLPREAPGPSWEAWSKIDHILALATSRGATVPLLVAGDLHHYCRYQTEGPSPRHYVTCGGGGAFTLGTAGTPEALSFDDMATARRVAAYPSQTVSEGMRRGAWRLVIRHKAFCATLAALMLGLVWVLNTASLALSTAPAGPSVTAGPLIASLLDGGGAPGMLRDLLVVAIYNPAALALTMLVAAGFVLFANTGATAKTAAWPPPVAGLLHFLAQLAAAFGIATLASAILGALDVPAALGALLTAAFGVTVGWGVHGLLMAVYLLLSNATIGLHELELYSSQAIQNWKSFLRIRVDREGLTVFPIGLAEITRWRPAPLAAGSTPPPRQSGLARTAGRPQTLRVPLGATHLFDPVDPLRPELIEAPIHIPVRGEPA